MIYNFFWLGYGPNGTLGNFGDVLTPKILDYFGIKYTFTRNFKDDFNAISVGSIAKYAKPGTIVLGSGFMTASKHGVNRQADYRFVRGPRSRKKILEKGGQCPEIYGDPAMLLPIMCDESKKMYDLGLIPHVKHYRDIKKKYPKHHVINLETNNALDVAKEITKCRSIISSSLHGIIAAHAYGIPAAWTDWGKMYGDGIKFHDHYESIGLIAEQSTIDDPIFTTGSYDVNPAIEIFKSLK